MGRLARVEEEEEAAEEAETSLFVAGDWFTEPTLHKQACQYKQPVTASFSGLTLSAKFSSHPETSDE